MLPDTASTQIESAAPHRRAFGILNRVAHDRSRVYRWLALGFYPPDADLAAALNSGQLVAELEAATLWLGADQKRFHLSLSGLRQRANLSLSQIETEYEALFGSGVERVSLRESAYRWREASSLLAAKDDLAQALRQHYARFEVTPINGQEDHVAVELEFLTYLCGQEAEAWIESAARARELREQEHVFLDDHPRRWLAEFLWRVAQRQPCSFYAHLARFCDAWLSLDHGSNYATMLK